MKRALITGVLGQDGSYLAEFLLKQGYVVFGLVRHSPDATAIGNELSQQGVKFLYGDLRDTLSLNQALHRSWPDELYNLAAQSFVPPSWVVAEETLNVNAAGVARILELVERIKPDTRVYQASTSEMFGQINGAADEETRFRPESPYGVAKLAAHELVRLYRKRGLFAVGGLLFNHESPRRGPEMVTRKIAIAVGRWMRDHKTTLELGSLDAKRDWGYAGEYVVAMHKMLQQPIPTDYVIGTGHTYSVKEFLGEALRYATGEMERDFDRLISWAEQVGFLRFREDLKRHTDLKVLRADPKRARLELEWEAKVQMPELVRMMVEAERERAEKEAAFN